MYEINTTTATAFDKADMYLEMIFEKGVIDVKDLTVQLHSDPRGSDPVIIIESIPDGVIVTNNKTGAGITLHKRKPDTYIEDSALVFHNELKKLNEELGLTHAIMSKTANVKNLSELMLKLTRLCFVLADDELDKDMNGLHTSVSNTTNHNNMRITVSNDMITVNAEVDNITDEISCDIPLSYEDQLRLVNIFMKLENI